MEPYGYIYLNPHRNQCPTATAAATAAATVATTAAPPPTVSTPTSFQHHSIT